MVVMQRKNHGLNFARKFVLGLAFVLPGPLVNHAQQESIQSTEATSTGSEQDGKRQVRDSQVRTRSDAMQEQRANENMALQFLRQNHPELEQYLNELRRKYPIQFHRAISEIARNAERFDELQQRNPRLYEFSIDQWKLESRIKLLAVQYAVQPSDEQLQRVKELVHQQLLQQQQRISEEKKRLEARLERINEQLNDFDSRQDEIIEDRAKNVTQRAVNQLKQSRIRKEKSKTDQVKD